MKFTSKYFWKFLLSYVLVMLFPVILSIIAMQNIVVNMMEQSFYNSTVGILNQTMSAADITFSSATNLAARLSRDNIIISASNFFSNFDNYQAQKQLERYMSTNEYIKDIAIHSIKSQRTTAASGIYSTENFYKTVYKDDMYDNYRTELENTPFNTIIATENKNFITVAYKININHYDILTVLIDKNIIKNSLEGAISEHSNAVALIVGLDDNVIVSVKENDLLSKEFAALKINDDKIAKVKIMGKKYYAIKKTSSYNGYIYTVAITVDAFRYKAFSSLWMMYLLIMAVILTSGAVIYYSLKYNYNPIREIMNWTKRVANDDINDISSLQRAVENIVNTNEILESEVQKNKGHVRRQLMQELLMGSVQNINEISELLIDMESNFASAQYAVIIAKFDEQNYCDMDIEEMILEVASEDFKLYDVKGLISDGIVLVISSAVLEYDSVSEIANKVFDFLSVKFGYKITIGVGSICSDMRAIAQSYIDATTAMDWQFVMGKGRIIEFEKLPKEFSEHVVKLSEVSDIKRLIKCGDTDGVIKLIDSVTTELCSGEYHLYNVKCVCYEIINVTIQTINEINIDPGLLSRDYLNVISLNECQTAYELISIISSMCREICAIIVKSKESGNTRLRDHIQEYIESNFSDFNFSLESMADHFGISYSYLSRYFKDQTGKNITEYVSEKRMEKAKFLLLTSDLTTIEIMESVGYSSIPSFNRKFKQETGMTPKDFRNTVKGMN